MTHLLLLYINSLPNVNLGIDTAICDGATLLLDVGLQQGSSYLWSDNSTGPSIKVTNAGPYSVTVTSGNGCKNTKNIDIISTDCADKMDRLIIIINLFFISLAFTVYKIVF